MKITIEGKVGSGKSLLGTLIARVLRMHGYTVLFAGGERDDVVIPINWDCTTDNPRTCESYVEIVESHATGGLPENDRSNHER